MSIPGVIDFKENRTPGMKILVTNDDGIFAPELWILVKELKNVAQVAVVAPDREQSAIGTAVTLRRPLKVHSLNSVTAGVEAYSVEGTPADSVILALGKLVKDKIDLIISGINPGPNLGDNVLVSGTVGAALQGYQHGVSSLAISVGAPDNRYFDNAAKLAALLAKKIDSNVLPENIFLNVNLPALPLAEIRGIEITEVASKAYADTVEVEDDGRRKYYWLIRQQVGKDTHKKTDIGAIERGSISITPLHANLFCKPFLIPDSLCSDLLQELRSMGRS